MKIDGEDVREDAKEREKRRRKSCRREPLNSMIGIPFQNIFFLHKYHC